MLQAAVNRMKLIIFLAYFLGSFVSPLSKRFPNHNHIKVKKAGYVPPIVKPATKVIDTFKKPQSLEDEIYSTPTPRFDIFVRKYERGFWNILKTIPSDETTESMMTSLQSLSGLEEEIHRQTLDMHVQTLLYGSGLGGEKSFIQETKKTYPALKKLKPREFEFGYKYVASETTKGRSSGENTAEMEGTEQPRSESIPLGYDSAADSVIFSIPSQERQRLALRQSRPDALLDDESLYYNSSTPMLSIEEMYEQANNLNVSPGVLHVSDNTKALDTQLQDFFHSIYRNKLFKRLVIACDGSAVFKNSTCMRASAGVFVMATTIDEQPLPLHLPQPVSPNDFSASSSSLPFDTSFAFRVVGASRVVSTPFDAELVGALAAVSVARSFQRFLSQQQSVSQVTDTFNAPEHAHTSLCKDIIIMTDSKTVCRMLRRSSDQTDEDTALSNRGLPSRRIIYQQISKMLGRIETGKNVHSSESSSSSDQSMKEESSESDIFMDLSVEWVNGHPERRVSDRSEWSLRDRCIWLADELAKGNIDSLSLNSIPVSLAEDNERAMKELGAQNDPIDFDVYQDSEATNVQENTPSQEDVDIKIDLGEELDSSESLAMSSLQSDNQQATSVSTSRAIKEVPMLELFPWALAK